VKVFPVAPGAFRVERDGKSDIVYVAGPDRDRWVFWNGHAFQIHDVSSSSPQTTSARPAIAETVETLSAPMPARIVQILVEPHARVRKGDTLVLLEAMKMELPVRATRDAEVVKVHSRPGELVDADAPLVDLR
jgi:biotin carboxyl carrier protein